MNPYKPSAIFDEYRQTVQTQSKMRRLICISTVCLQNIILKFEYTTQQPFKWKLTGPIYKSGKFYLA